MLDNRHLMLSGRTETTIPGSRLEQTFSGEKFACQCYSTAIIIALSMPHRAKNFTPAPKRPAQSCSFNPFCGLWHRHLVLSQPQIEEEFIISLHHQH